MKLREGELTGRIIDCITRVHRTLGGGFLEDVYKNAMMVELKNAGMEAEADKEIVVYYSDHPVGVCRPSILVGERVVLGVRAVRRLEEHHYAELRSHLKAAGLEVGMLVNFAAQRADFRRVENVARDPRHGHDEGDDEAYDYDDRQKAEASEGD